MKPKLVFIAPVIILQLAVNTILGAAWILPRNAEVIPAGITVNGSAIGGMSREQAIAFLFNEYLVPYPYIDKEIELSTDSISWIMNTKDLGSHYDCVRTVDSILADNHGMNAAIRAIKLQAKTVDVPLAISWNRENLVNYLDSINEQIVIPAREATLNYSDGMITVTPEQPGEGLDMELSTARILESLAIDQPGRVALAKKTLFPRVTAQDLNMVDGILAQYTTELTNDADRSHNIMLAAQLLDGSLVRPGETFSFNDRVGRRTAENGFRKAPVIWGVTVQQDLGGGICQAASTLYNAALMANVQIIERTGHTIPVKYVPHGLDATVAFDYIDFQFKNTLAHPIVIQSKVINNVLTINLLGTLQDKQSSKI